MLRCLIAAVARSNLHGHSNRSFSRALLLDKRFGLHWQTRLAGPVAYCALTRKDSRAFILPMPATSSELCYVVVRNEDFIIACGENNAFDLAFVGLFGIFDEPCFSPPGGRPRYRFANAPLGPLRRYILFPQTELIAARQKPYGHAFHMRRYRDHVIVEIETGGNGGSFLYHFSHELEPKYVFPSGTHEFQHVDLERAGKIDHSWSVCPELEKALRLRVWEPSTDWHDQLIPWRDNPWKETQGAVSSSENTELKSLRRLLRERRPVPQHSRQNKGSWLSIAVGLCGR